MPNPIPKSARRLALLAGAFGAALIASSANAQDYGRDGGPYAANAGEEVQVYSPRLRSERAPLGAPLEKVSLSAAVPYDDLNLRTRSGARELRLRVRQQAAEVCSRLAEAYPVHEANGTSCYKTALEDAIVRANSAIDTARQYRTYSD